MLGRFKDATLNAIGSNSRNDKLEKHSENDMNRSGQKNNKPERFLYCRPYFLGLSCDEVQSALDFGIRPILKPRKIHDMPLLAGYAEYECCLFFTGL